VNRTRIHNKAPVFIVPILVSDECVEQQVPDEGADRPERGNGSDGPERREDSSAADNGECSAERVLPCLVPSRTFISRLYSHEQFVGVY
jgi:hypothetical protein